MLGSAGGKVNGDQSERQMNGQMGHVKIKGVKLEYKETERQVDFFSDYTSMFVGYTPTLPMCPSIPPSWSVASALFMLHFKSVLES